MNWLLLRLITVSQLGDGLKFPNSDPKRVPYEIQEENIRYGTPGYVYG